MYNGKLVLDQIAEYKIYQLLYSRKPLVLCYETWGGRYEHECYLNYSLNYRIVYAILLHKKNQKDFVGYFTNFPGELKQMFTLYGAFSKGKKIENDVSL